MGHVGACVIVANSSKDQSLLGVVHGEAKRTTKELEERGAATKALLPAGTRGVIRVNTLI